MVCRNGLRAQAAGRFLERDGEPACALTERALNNADLDSATDTTATASVDTVNRSPATESKARAEKQPGLAPPECSDCSQQFAELWSAFESFRHEMASTECGKCGESLRQMREAFHKRDPAIDRQIVYAVDQVKRELLSGMTTMNTNTTVLCNVKAQTVIDLKNAQRNVGALSYSRFPCLVASC